MPVWGCLAALRWVVGMAELRGLTLNPKYNISDARSVIDVKKPENLNVLPAWDIRPARDAADLFFSRCWAELTALCEDAYVPQDDCGHGTGGIRLLREGLGTEICPVRERS